MSAEAMINMMFSYAAELYLKRGKQTTSDCTVMGTQPLQAKCCLSPSRTSEAAGIIF